MLALIFKEPNCCFSYTSFLLIIFNIIHQFIDQTNVSSSRQILKNKNNLCCCIQGHFNIWVLKSTLWSIKTSWSSLWLPVTSSSFFKYQNKSKTGTLKMMMMHYSQHVNEKHVTSLRRNSSSLTSDLLVYFWSDLFVFFLLLIETNLWK